MGRGAPQEAVARAAAHSVLAVVGLGAAGWTQGSEAYRRVTAKPAVTWFAPYDDVNSALTPTFISRMWW